MVKKFLPSLLAVVTAICALAFKAGDSAPFQDTHTFYYTAPDGSYAEEDVEDKANWSSNPSATPTCSGSAKACRMQVDDTYTEDVGGVRVFRTSGSVANINAVVGSGSNYVPSTSSPSVGIISKADRPL